MSSFTRPKLKTYQPGDVRRYAQIKYDGQWLEMHRVGGLVNYAVRCTTRHPTDITLQIIDHPTVDAFRRAPTSLGERHIVCELYAPGRPASFVKSALADRNLDALSIVMFASAQCSADTSLEELQDLSDALGVPYAKYWELNRFNDKLSLEDIDWKGVPDAEGLVLKNSNLKDWVKIKDEQETDLVCVGYTDGTGKNTGLIGSIICALWDPIAKAPGRIVATAGGLSDAERIRVGDDEDAYLGKVLKVRYQYVGSQGRLRHPRFVEWRDDKQPEECTEI